MKFLENFKKQTRDRTQNYDFTKAMKQRNATRKTSEIKYMVAWT